MEYRWEPADFLCMLFSFMCLPLHNYVHFFLHVCWLSQQNVASLISFLTEVFVYPQFTPSNIQKLFHSSSCYLVNYTFFYYSFSDYPSITPCISPYYSLMQMMTFTAPRVLLETYSSLNSSLLLPCTLMPIGSFHLNSQDNPATVFFTVLIDSIASTFTLCCTLLHSLKYSRVSTGNYFPSLR